MSAVLLPTGWRFASGLRSLLLHRAHGLSNLHRWRSQVAGGCCAHTQRREVIDRYGYLVDLANTNSKMWKEEALVWVAKGRELAEDLKKSSGQMKEMGA